MNKRNLQLEFPKLVLIAITAILIIVTGVMFKQRFIRILPLFISLFIVTLQARANRYAYIAGGLNACVYTYVYIRLGLYASAARALLFSAPIQILTFLNWNRHSYKDSTVFRKMNVKTRIFWTAVLIAVWCVVFAILKFMKSNYAFLDNTCSLLGIVAVLTMLAYIEYLYL